jgi:hypothetical protein
MVHKVETTFDTDETLFFSSLPPILSGQQKHEALIAFQFLKASRRLFPDLNLIAISHHSNPDDPPDVVAHFQSHASEECEIPIEITSVDPPHIHQCNALHRKVGGNQGRMIPRMTVSPRNQEEALDEMYGNGTAWESVADRNALWTEKIVSAAKRKFESSKIQNYSSGILLIEGEFVNGVGEREAVREAFETIRSDSQNFCGWTLAAFRPLNVLENFTEVSEGSHRPSNQQ